MSARFEAVLSDAEQPWHLRIASTRILAASETYTRQAGPRRVVRAIVRAVLDVAADSLEEWAAKHYPRGDDDGDLSVRIAYTSAAETLRHLADDVTGRLVTTVDER